MPQGACRCAGASPRARVFENPEFPSPVEVRRWPETNAECVGGVRNACCIRLRLFPRNGRGGAALVVGGLKRVR